MVAPEAARCRAAGAFCAWTAGAFGDLVDAALGEPPGIDRAPFGPRECQRCRLA
jgi:hypothetical protein